MATKPVKKTPAPKKPAASAPRAAPEAPDAKTLPLKGKKVLTPRAPPPPPPTAPRPPTTPTVPVTPPPEANGHERQLCWIELVKNGNTFIARANTTGGTSKEYKNRVLEDMLTELMIELNEDIQE